MSTQQNSVILNSLPLDANLKRYFRCKWAYLCKHNGESFASNVFKDLREIVQSYIADTQRLLNKESYVKQMNIRDKAKCRQLLSAADSQPHAVLDLLKIYTGLEQPVVTPTESAYAQHKMLSSRAEAIDSTVPTEFGDRGLRAWFCNKLLKAKDHYNSGEVMPPMPDWYKDYSNEQSAHQQSDYWDLVDIYWYLPSDLQDLVDREYPDVARDSMESSYCGDYVVGEIHHIPKKGTVKRRPIAAPNRYLQSMLEPVLNYLFAVLKRMERDCTFDQNRFVKEIDERIQSGKYVGSVDLSQATDNLPFSWGVSLIEMIGLPEDIKSNWNLFKWMVDQPWQNGPFIDKWTVGQPLGTWPSFAVLGLTHNAVCEALSRKCGRYDHPYVVLGDDVIFYDKQVREAYIELMQKHGVPLSLHKSYENRLVEFAGRMFIKGQSPRFVSDHAIIGWSNLFDYQRSTGIFIDFKNLPKKLQRRWMRRSGLPNDLAIYAYRLAAKSESGRVLTREGAQEAYFFYRESGKDEVIPDRDTCLGWFRLGDALGNLGESASRKQSDWYKQKFRPVTTDCICNAAVRSTLSILGAN